MNEFLTETAVLIDGDVRPRADILDDIEEVTYAPEEIDEHRVYDRRPFDSRRVGNSAVASAVARPVVEHRDRDWRECQFKD